jgi:hypothetical protein
MGIILGGNNLTGTNFSTLGDTPSTPNMVTDGLVLWLDAGNNSSYINSSNYYDCGYGCQYYSSNPGCTSCNSQWKDISGFGNDGTLVNGTSIVYDSNSGGGSMNFDGVNDRVDCGTFSVPYLTVSTWVYKTSSTTNQGICRKENGWAVSQFNGTLQVAPGTSWTFYNTSYTIPLNTWVNITYTYSGTGGSNSQVVYINGSSIFNTSAGSGAITDNSNQVRVGFDDNNWFWNGRIATTLVYNRPLSATEVLQNFNNGRQRFGI